MMNLRLIIIALIFITIIGSRFVWAKKDLSARRQSSGNQESPDPEINALGYAAGIPVKWYGRRDLMNIENRATAEDVPLKPGQSCILKIASGESAAFPWPGIWGGIESTEADTNIPDWTKKKIVLVFEGINFGDGTGLGPSGGALGARQ